MDVPVINLRRRFAECGSRRTNGWLSDRVGDRAPTPTTLTNEWKAARSLWFLESDPASRLRPRIGHCETVMPPAKKAAPSAKTIAAPAKTAAIHEGQARSPKATLEWATFPRIFLRSLNDSFKYSNDFKGGPRLDAPSRTGRHNPSSPRGRGQEFTQ